MRYLFIFQRILCQISDGSGETAIAVTVLPLQRFSEKDIGEKEMSLYMKLFYSFYLCIYYDDKNENENRRKFYSFLLSFCIFY